MAPSPGPYLSWWCLIWSCVWRGEACALLPRVGPGWGSFGDRLDWLPEKSQNRHSRSEVTAALNRAWEQADAGSRAPLRARQPRRLAALAATRPAQQAGPTTPPSAPTLMHICQAHWMERCQRHGCCKPRTASAAPFVA